MCCEAKMFRILVVVVHASVFNIFLKYSNSLILFCHRKLAAKPKHCRSFATNTRMQEIFIEEQQQQEKNAEINRKKFAKNCWPKHRYLHLVPNFYDNLSRSLATNASISTAAHDRLLKMHTNNCFIWLISLMAIELSICTSSGPFNSIVSAINRARTNTIIAQSQSHKLHWNRNLNHNCHIEKRPDSLCMMSTGEMPFDLWHAWKWKCNDIPECNLCIGGNLTIS